jgi:hypothetical protein
MSQSVLKQCPNGQVFANGKCNTSTPAKCQGSQILVTVQGSPDVKCVGSESEMYAPDIQTGPPKPLKLGDLPHKFCKDDDLLVSLVSFFPGQPGGMRCLSKKPTDVTPTNTAIGNADSTGYGDILKNLGQEEGVTGRPSSLTGNSAPIPGSGGQALLTGNTTGGSSATSLGSTAGGGGDRRKQIFGPLFTSRGEGAGSGAASGNSTKDNTYPELLGGGVPKKSTRIDGAGIVPPSKNSDTTGLPSSAGLGSDEASKYFPTSRVPGDMDLIPDPYRVSQSFSASNYSVKNEPVPFLTDFSAFQK